MRRSTLFQIIALFILTNNFSFSTELVNGNPVEYLIITPSMFVDSLQPLIASKISQGLSVNMVTLNEINTQFTGRDIQEQIRNCIKDRYENHNAYWILLVGKADADDSPETNGFVNTTVVDKSWEMPVRYVYSPDPGMNMVYIPTDNYYSCLDGDWDLDGDNIFGENAPDCDLGISEVDWIPEVCLGRIPCETVTQLGNYIRKLIATDYSGYNLAQLNSLQIYCKVDTNETDLNVPGKILASSPYDTAYITKVNSELNDGSYPILFFTGHGNKQGISLQDGVWTGEQLRDGGSKFFAYIAGCEVGQTDDGNFDPNMDQSQAGTNNYFFIWSTSERWQDFKPTVSNLSKIGLFIWKWGSPGNLIVKIATSSGEILQQHSIDPSLITSGWVGIDLSPPLTLTPDSTYRILVSTAAPSVYPDVYGWYGQTSSSYTRGLSSVESSSPGFDFAFATNAIDPSMSFVENILFKPNCGAIGCVAAWRLSSPLGQVDLWKEFVRAFFDGSNTYTGEAFKQAQRTFYSTFMYWSEGWYPYWHYTSLVYEFYGDPQQKIGNLLPNGPQIVSVPRVLSPYNSNYKYDQNSAAEASGLGTISWRKIYGPDYFSISDPGFVTWVPQIGEPGNGGRPEVCIQASDINGSTRQRWVVQCGNSFRINSIPVESVSVGNEYLYSPSTVGGTNVRWKKLVGPENLSVDINTGTMNWIPGSIGRYEVILQAFTGTTFKSPDPQRYEITVTPSPDTMQYVLNEGWNMISLPLEVPDARRTTLFPAATSDAFYYEGSYVPCDTLKTGKGYWLKFASTESVDIIGLPCMLDTFEGNMGWNMIGSIFNPIWTSSITSIPEGLITSEFFEYNGANYVTTDTIYPGKGYWVKVNQDGKLILSSTTESLSKARINIQPTSEMPPAPPSDIIGRIELPKEYRLEQNYPNPFNPITTIKYGLPLSSHVKLRIFNVLGQVVTTLKDEEESAGYKHIEWNSSAVASGIYFYRLEATSISDPSKSFTQVRKMILIK